MQASRSVLTLSALATTLCLALAAPAQAGSVDSAGAWSPTGCGARPEAPTVDLKNVDTFNRSVDLVNAYRQKNKAFLDCLAIEANADIQALVKAATAAQQAAQAAGRQANEKIEADVKTANEKFK